MRKYKSFVSPPSRMEQLRHHIFLSVLLNFLNSLSNIKICDFLLEQVLRHHIYVDGIFAGVHSLEDALEVKNQTIDFLAAGGFHLVNGSAHISSKPRRK